MNELQQLPLRDIHLPEMVSWWPPAYGWWLLPVLLAVLVGIARWLGRWPTRRHAVRLRERALRELDAIAVDYERSGDARSAVAAMSILLRRLALSLAPRSQVASLTGERWLQWLRPRCDSPVFLNVAPALAALPYQPDPQADVRALLAGCRAFVNSVR